jgi:CRP/FNR family transcriptional regulator, transcriptional activator FtrB
VQQESEVQSTDLQDVRKLPLFNTMAEDNFFRLTDAALVQRLPQGTVVLQEGAMPDFLYILLDGLVEIFTEQGSGPVGISLVRPVTPLILAAIVVDQPYLNSARTLADSRLLLLRANLVRDVFGLDASFARALVSELAFAYRGAVKKLKGQMARSSTERLANWVLSELRYSEQPKNFIVPFDRATLASHIGTTRENLSRSLALLTNHGLRVRRREIVVDDAASLARFAKPQTLIDDPSS